jgi:hypothetical protein
MQTKLESDAALPDALVVLGQQRAPAATVLPAIADIAQ